MSIHNRVGEVVLAASVTSTAELVGQPCRVRSISVRSAGTAGTVVLKDGGSSGTTKITINTPAAIGFHTILVPGGGMEFATDCYATLTTADAVLVFYVVTGP